MPSSFNFRGPLLRGLQIAATVTVAASLLQACGGGDDTPYDGKKTIQPVRSVPAGIQALQEQRARWAEYARTTEPGKRPKAQLGTALRRGGAAVQAQELGAGGDSALTPQQVRSRYGLPALPADFNNLTPAQKAAFGQGQTIVIVNPYHAPHLHAELRAFSERFGLPVCEEQADWNDPSNPVPARLAQCAVRRHYSVGLWDLAPDGSTPARQPGINTEWAREASLLTQWAHAMAPLADIVLLELHGEDIEDIAVDLETVSWYAQSQLTVLYPVVPSYSNFPTSLRYRGYSNVVPAGQTGQAPNVFAQSGASVTVGASAIVGGVDVHDGSSGFYWQGWDFAEYQLGLPGSPDMEYGARRTPDLLFNGSATSGQLALVRTDSGSFQEMSGFGTRLSAAQWAGVTAVANAQRKLAGKQSLSDERVNRVLYDSYRNDRALYSQAFQDVVSTTASGCSECVLADGYDLPSGLGSPRLQTLLPLLVQAQLEPDTPWVSTSEILVRGQSAFKGSLNWWAWGQPAAVRLKSGPAGLTLSPQGTIQWPTPVVGNYVLDIEVTGLEFEPFTVSVPLKADVANRPPVLELPSADYFEQWVGYSHTIPLNVSDPEADHVTTTLCIQGRSTCIDAPYGVASIPRLAEGTYAVDITARDALGATVSKQATLRVVQPPIAVVSSISLRGTAGAAGSASLRNAASTATTAVFALSSGLSGLSVSPDGTLSWSAQAPRYVYTSVRVTGAGKPTLVLTVSLNILGASAPVVPTGRSGDATVNRPFTLYVGATDRDGGDALTFSLQGAPEGMTVDSVGRLHWQPKTAGVYTVTLVATDTTGLTGSASVVVRVAPNSPPVVAAASWTVNSGAAFTAQVAASDPDGDALTYALAQAPAGMSIVTGGVTAGRLQWAAPVVGTHRFQVTVRDAKGEPRSAWMTLNVLANAAPVVKAGQTGAAVVNRPFTLMVAATDANKDALTFALSGAPAGMTVDTQGRLHWTPSATGTFTFSFIAKDPAGLTGSAAVTVVVAPNEAPVMAGATWTATAGVLFTAQVQASDPDGDALNFSLTQAPAGMSVVATGPDAGKVTWAQPVAGTYKVQVTVRDSKGAPRSAWFTLTVKATFSVLT